MNDNITLFPRRPGKTTTMLNTYSGDSMASDAATATAVHMHVFSRYLASTGRTEQAQVVMNMAKQVQSLAESIRPGLHQPF